MKFKKLILITILAGLLSIAAAAPYQNQNRVGQQGQRGQYTGYQPYSAYQDNEPVDIYMQGALGLASNYSNNNNSTYSDNNDTTQLGGAASVEMGILLNIANTFVVGPQIGYVNATTNAKTANLGNTGAYSLQLKTKVPTTNYGVLAGVKFAGGLGLFYMDMGYATNGKETIQLEQGNTHEKTTLVNLDQTYMGFGGRYNVTPNLFVGLEYRAYNILNTTSYTFQYSYENQGNLYTIYQPINTSVGIFNFTLGMNL